MRRIAPLVLLLAALLAAGCGGAAEAERAEPPPTILQAEPTVDQFAGTPIAMVFFHPL